MLFNPSVGKTELNPIVTTLYMTGMSFDIDKYTIRYDVVENI